MDFSRRSFLRGLIAVPILVGAPKLLVARPALTREPFVRVGDHVDYVGLNLHPAPCWAGSKRVHAIEPWNGSFWPVQVEMALHRVFEGFPTGRETRRVYRAELVTIPDHDLADLFMDESLRDWHLRSPREWPNVHSWVRHQRLGEHPDVSRAKLRAAQEQLPWPHRGEPAALLG